MLEQQVLLSSFAFEWSELPNWDPLYAAMNRNIQNSSLIMVFFYEIGCFLNLQIYYGLILACYREINIECLKLVKNFVLSMFYHRWQIICESMFCWYADMYEQDLIENICISESYISFFSMWVFFHEHSWITGLQGKGWGISLTPHYHFHPLRRHLGISRATTAESSPLHIASSRIRTGSLWFPSASC